MSSTLFLPASVALVLSILYTLNGAFVTRQLQTGTVHFPKDNNKPFATNSSRSSPLTKSIERPANLGPFRGQRGNYSTSNQGAKNTQKIEDDSFGRKPGLQSPETPVFDRVNSEMKEVPKGVLTNPQSTEKEKVFNRRVTSWFTDVGDTKKDIPLNSESTFTQPSDFLKQDLDAREQYIKSKQYRDFMDPLPSNQKKSSIMKITEDSVRKFNKKFSESGDESLDELEVRPGTLKNSGFRSQTWENPESQNQGWKTSEFQLQNPRTLESGPQTWKTSDSQLQNPGDSDSRIQYSKALGANPNLGKPKISAVELIEKNYRPTTTPYQRKPIPEEKKSQNPEQNQVQNLPSYFEASQNSQISKFSSSSNSELNFFLNESKNFQERAIDVDSKTSSPIVPEFKKKKSIEKLNQSDVEGKSKNERINIYKNISNFDHSLGAASYRSIGVDDDPGTALTPDKTFASGLNSTFKEEKTSASGSGTTVMRDETFSPGPGIPLMKDEMFVSGPSTIVKHHVTFASGSEKTTPEKIEGSRTAWTSEKAFTSGPSTFPSTRGDHDSGSGSRSLSSLNSNSSKTPERGDSPQESSAGSTVRIDDIDRRTLRSPLRDTSLMTTSTIVSLNSTNIANWTKNTETQKYNNPEIKRHGNPEGKWSDSKKGFDVIIRSRESPINRPQSVTLSTEFPSFPQNTTLRIKSPPESSQYSRQSSTQL